MKAMSNFLKNGTVLPSGLLSHNGAAIMEGFKKTFQNKTLKAGIVVASYATTDQGNLSKLYPEYDVLAFEQNEDKGSTVSIYKNCPVASSLGSIADYFEMTVRPLQKKTTSGTVPSPSGQDGSIVLLLCLNGMSDTGIIVGSLPHPDRPTNIEGTAPQLYGEYNGVNVVVNQDGSTSLTFKGATDSYGVPTDSSQGNTVVSIATDGSFQVQHSTITFTLDKSGSATRTTSGNTTINCQDANINCTNSTVTASDTAIVEGKTVKLGVNASNAAVLGDIFKSYFDTHIHPTPIGPSGPPVMPMPPSTLSKKVEVE
jgi:hypothetical protein